MTQHTSTAFERDIASLRDATAALFDAVACQVAGVEKALRDDDVDSARHVLAQDARVNAAQMKLDGEIEAILALRQPRADDLRTVIGISRISADLERAGDELRNIARGLLRMAEVRARPECAPKADLLEGLMILSDMLCDVRTALSDADAKLAHSVIGRDRMIDDIYRRLLRTLETGLMQTCGAATLEAMAMARALERTGDHLKNVAEAVLYVRDGSDLRHAGT